MLSLCISHVITVVSPFRSNVFYFLAKLSQVYENGCICVLGFFATVIHKAAKLRKSVTEKRDPKKHLSLSVAVRDKHVNGIPRPKVGVSVVV